MKCKKIKDYLFEYTEGLLDNDTKKEVKEHLAVCKDCQAEYKAVIEYKTGMSRLKKVEAPSDFLSKVHTRIRQDSLLERIYKKLFIPFKVKVPLELAGVIATAVFLIWFIPSLQKDTKTMDIAFKSKSVSTGTHGKARSYPRSEIDTIKDLSGRRAGPDNGLRNIAIDELGTSMSGDKEKKEEIIELVLLVKADKVTPVFSSAGEYEAEGAAATEGLSQFDDGLMEPGKVAIKSAVKPKPKPRVKNKLSKMRSQSAPTAMAEESAPEEERSEKADQAEKKKSDKKPADKKEKDKKASASAGSISGKELKKGQYTKGYLAKEVIKKEEQVKSKKRSAFKNKKVLAKKVLKEKLMTGPRLKQKYNARAFSANVKKMITDLKGKIIKEDYDKKSNQLKSLTVEIPVGNYKLFIRNLNNFGSFKNPAPTKINTDRKMQRSKIQYLHSK